MENYVKLENVTKVYKIGEVEIRAADGIDFSISKGEFVVIVGPSEKLLLRKVLMLFAMAVLVKVMTKYVLNLL